MNRWYGKVLFFFLCLTLVLTSALPLSAQAAAADSKPAPRWVAPKPAHTVIVAGQSREIVNVKFVEGTSYRLRQGAIVTQGNDDLAGIRSVLDAYPVQAVERLFTQPEEEIAADKLALESASGEQMPDLNLWYQFWVGRGVKPEKFIDALNALPEVEIAYPAPLPAPLPTLAQSAGSNAPAEPPTPSYVASQLYLNAAPGGINAQYAWTQAGGLGQNVTIVDVEYSFNATHEDLKNIPVVGGAMYHGFGDDHGTAVQGEIIGKHNAYGVTGIAYNAVSKFSSACTTSACSSYNPANAINIGRLNTASGDVILIEQQTSVCGLSDYGPLEWDQAVFDAIKTATTAGRNVVEAAGNGSVNLDQAGCLNKFNRSVRDSGAIIVGAGAPPGYTQVDRSRLDFSTYGSRVDVQGYGRNVATTGYGDLYTGSGENQWYTAVFSGTSSASPIVTGAVALLSSIAQQRGAPQTPAWIRTMLTNTGSAQQSDPSYPASQHIGPRPNLTAAIAKLPATGFNSTFAANANGWTAVKGTWNVNTTTGMFVNQGGPLDRWHSVSHAGNYPTLTYEARMKRTVCTWCANNLVIRGNPTTLDSVWNWKNSYTFQYQNSFGGTAQGGWSVWKIKGGTITSLHQWTASSYVVPYGFNVLKVTAKGSALKFYINGHLVWSGTDAALTTGQVGIEMYQGDTTTTNTTGALFVDWAKLSTTVAAPAPDESVEEAPGPTSDADITGFLK